MNSFQYLVYDIESIAHKSLINKVLYPGENLNDEEAYQKHVLELQEEGRDFINPSFHQPISLAALAVAEDFSLTKIGVLGGEKPTTSSIVTEFWKIYNEKSPVLVDFNGKGYDIRLMELWAFQLGISIHSRHFSKFGPRYKFAEDQHIDLHDFLSNFGAIRWRGGLDLFSKLLGKPGKMETKGDQVQELYDQNKLWEINDYCLSDAMDTYFVFLRTRVLKGELSLKREHDLVDQAKIMMEEKKKTENYFKLYLENFNSWKPMG